MHRSLGVAEHCLPARGSWAAKQYSPAFRLPLRLRQDTNVCCCRAADLRKRFECIQTRNYQQTRVERVSTPRASKPRPPAGRPDSTNSLIQKATNHNRNERKQWQKAENNNNNIKRQSQNHNQKHGPISHWQGDSSYTLSRYDKSKRKAKGEAPGERQNSRATCPNESQIDTRIKSKSKRSDWYSRKSWSGPRRKKNPLSGQRRKSSWKSTGFDGIYEAEESPIVHKPSSVRDLAHTPNQHGLLHVNGSERLVTLPQGRRKRHMRNKEAENAARKRLEKDIETCDIENPQSWDSLVHSITRLYSHNGAWAVFQFIRDRQLDSVFTNPDAEYLRNSVIDASVIDIGRLRALVHAADEHSVKFGFKWPNLSFFALQNQIHHGMDLSDTENHWILPLCSSLTSSQTAQLIAQFSVDAFDSTPEILKAIYAECSDKTLYDKIIPFFFKGGNSRQAMIWRKILVSSGDLPQSIDSVGFLQFLTRYYPSVKLSEQEHLIMQSQPSHPDKNDATANSSSAVPEHHRSGQFSDKMVAKWFASSWTPMEFALNFVQRLGLVVIGPQSLQALALRDPDCKTVCGRIKQLSKLGIEIESRIYCSSIVHFAESDNEMALTSLLNSDIHPDEFENADTRKKLLQAATHTGDLTTAKLMEQIELAVSSMQRDAAVIPSALIDRDTRLPTSRIQYVLDRMRRSALEPTQNEAMQILYYLFKQLPAEGARDVRERNHLFRAANVTLGLASRDIAIPTRYWRALLASLLKTQEWKRLRQLCSKLTSLYLPYHRPMMPVHVQDVPQTMGERRRNRDASLANTDEQPAPSTAEGYKATSSGFPNDRSYFPSDLAFSHRNHPLSIIFNSKMQRAITRAAFQTMQSINPPVQEQESILARQESAPDFTRGVALLAILRDHGVVVDEQVIVSAAIYEYCLSRIPGANRHRDRDSLEKSSQALKSRMDAAWGGPVMPAVETIDQMVIKKTPPALTRHSRLIMRRLNPFDRRTRRAQGARERIGQSYTASKKKV